MTDLFLGVVNLSLSASWLAAAVLGFRFLLRKAPKSMHVALWGLVALRLLLPVSLESTWSLVPEAVGSGTVVEDWSRIPVRVQIPAGDPAVRPTVPDKSEASDPLPGQIVVDPGTVQWPDSGVTEPVSPTQTLGDTLFPLLAKLWLLGILGMTLYAVGSYGVLRWQVRMAVRMKSNIYQSEFVPTAFVLGLLRPRIYVPYGMDVGDLRYVIAHEQAHIDRMDHWWKPLGYLLLSVHWFNPLMWAVYFLLCRDIELACDERAIRGLSQVQRADYSQTLLACTVRQKMIFACPVAFGQAGVNERVKNVLNYRKPGLWITLVTVLAMIISLLCFYTVPPAQAEELEQTPAIPGAPNTGSSVTRTNADGIEYTVSLSRVTPVGLRFSVDVDARCVFLVDNYYWIERQTDTGWEALPAMLTDPCHMASQFLASGNSMFPGPTDTRSVDWSGIYGVLEPGSYRLCTVVFEGEEPCSVEFTIGDPGNSAAAQALTRYYQALNALLARDSYHIRYTDERCEDRAVDVDADPSDYNDINTFEVMRSGDNYLRQDYTYTTGMLNDGIMIRDGVEYRMDNEIYGDGKTPAIGWYQAPATDLEGFSIWISHGIWNADQVTTVKTEENTVTLSVTGGSYIAGPVLSDTVAITYAEDGSLKQVVQTTEFGPNSQQENGWTYINTLTVMDTEADAIAQLIQLQDVNFYRDFIWGGNVPADESVLDRAFVNTGSAAMETVSQVIERAKQETNIPFSNVMVYHDADDQVWKVEFWVGYGKAYTESVYLNADGTTILITHRGPLDV